MPTINFKVSVNDRSAIEQAAASQGLALSDFAREAVAVAVAAAQHRSKDPAAIALHIAKLAGGNLQTATIERWIREGVPVKGE